MMKDDTLMAGIGLLRAAVENIVLSQVKNEIGT